MMAVLVPAVPLCAHITVEEKTYKNKSFWREKATNGEVSLLV